MANRLIIVCLFCSLFLMGGTAYGYQLTNKLESLVMPGPLSKVHEKYKEQCSKCHSGLDKTQQKSLCIDCHETVGQDIKNTTGFHGRHSQASQSDCKSCHTDHEGRDADILGMNRETFNHDMTDFTLTGKHVSTDCNQCHLTGKKFHEAQADCLSCHEKDDSHQGDMGKDCATCHKPDGWQQVKFDHGKTKFPLKGLHEKVNCKSCHPDTRYKQTPTECFACHVNNDDHEGRFGSKCADCHSEISWKKTRFDHGVDTKFRLKGKHDTIDCEACHRSTDPKQKISKTCNACHAQLDIHKGRNGEECQQCHTETSWTKIAFSHDKDTKFPLNGAHKEVTCFACHRGEDKKMDTARVCVDCHKPDDVHNGQMGQNCAECHGETNWSANVSFDHDLTGFPLVGLHAITDCDECHMSAKFQDVKADCISCHETDDIHKQALGQNCGDCHNPNGWGFWQFDHNKQTDFILDGSHEGLACAACHEVPTKGKVRASKDCIDCHMTDDIHNGRFGKMCQRCHITESFKSIRIGR